MSKINKKKIAELYQVCAGTITYYFSEHLPKLRELATTRKRKDGKIVVRRDYNSKQLGYIVNEIMKDTPEGYDFDGKTFIRVKEG